MSDFTVTTNKADYQPGENALFSASNVEAGATVQFSVAHVNAGADGVYGTEDDQYTYDLTGTGITWSVTDGGAGDADGLANGIVITSWFINDDAANQTFQISAIDAAASDIATASFTDAPKPDVPPDPEVQTVNDAIFTATGTNGTGTGVFPAFVQLQSANNDTDDNNQTEEGFNTGNPPVLDTKSSATHNHEIQLQDIPTFTDDEGNVFLEFRLDINEPGTNQTIVLESLKLYWNTDPDLTTLPGDAFKLYDLDSDGETSATLVDWKSGSGQSDYVVRIPVDLTGHAGTEYIYLYSFISGIEDGPGGGFEEWSFQPLTEEPPPGNDPFWTISGIKYEDMNADGDKDAADDAPLADWAIFIYSDDNGNGLFDSGDGTAFSAATTTNAQGEYSFDSLSSGKYIVLEGSADGWQESPDDDTASINAIDTNKGTFGYAITIDHADVSDRDFANFEQIDLSGTKYTDTDGDGTGDTAGTPGYTFTINLYKWVDTDNGHDVDANELTLVDTTETDADNGTWSFIGLGSLADGEKYVVKEDGEDGWTQTFGNDGHIVDATSGNDTDDLDFANFKDLSLSGTKYTDTDGDGTGDEAGTPGYTFTINLGKWVDADNGHDVDASELTLLDSTETDADDGTWSFTGLGPLAAGEKYVVKEAGETGWTQTFGNDGHIVDATSGNDTEDLDFANFKNVELSGTKYTDVNGNDSNTEIGNDDTAGTPGQTFTINLYSWTDTDGQGDINASELTFIDSTETDETTGEWSFDNLGPLAVGASYVVQEEGETGWTQTFGTGGHVVDPTSGGDVGDLNFANFENFDISGYKWEDADAEGDWDAGEHGIQGWTIYLDDDNNLGNGYIKSDTTDANGKYEFTDLGPGTYYVYEGSQANWFNTYNGATHFDAESGVDHAGDTGVAEPLNFGNFHFIPDDRGLTKGFWGQHPEAWDGTIAYKKGAPDTQNLVNSGVLDKADVLPTSMDNTPTVDWNKDGVINGGDTGVLLGDANGNGAIDAGENTLFVSLAAAQLIIKSSESSNDTRQILMSQAIAAQLNIYNGVGEPNDLIGEAVAWLTGQGPYTYGTNSTGDVDRNNNGVLDTAGATPDYSTSTKAFLLDANFAASGTALTSNLQAWQLYVDVVQNGAITEWDKSPGTPGNQEVNGEGLKNALELFNQAKLVTDVSGNFVGYLSGGVVSNVNPNDPDYFWLTLHQHGGITGIA
jgi:hypothetical protein